MNAMVDAKNPDITHYQGFLLDVDGVIVRGNRPIPGSVEAVAKLQALGKTLFVSNNSWIARKVYAQTLGQLGIRVSEDEILNSGALVASYLSQHDPGAKVFVVGERGLCDEIIAAGHTLTEQGAGWLATGSDRNLSYDKLDRGLQVLLGGARWVASNADATYPSSQGLRPGAGSVVGAFCGMGFEPQAIVGKPSKFCMAQAQALLGVSDPQRILVIGDRLDSDIQGAAQMGMDSLLVFSGVTSKKNLENSSIQPTYVADDLAVLF